MNFSFNNKSITGILTILPKNVEKFDKALKNYNFSKYQSLRLKEIMGFNEKRVVKKNICVSDLSIYGLKYLFKRKLLTKDSIDALILVTQTPDYFVPPTTSIIHHKLQLKNNLICMDINQGCAGYIIGLIQAFLLLEQKKINKVVLINADVLSRKVSINDRNSHPIVGDAASITIIEKSNSKNKILASVNVSGRNYDALMIPAGGMKYPFSNKTSIIKKDHSGNYRSMEHLVMKGDQVFNFVLNTVPKMINDLIRDAKINKKDIDYYIFHQPNKFMLNKLANKIGIPLEKIPSNVVENFGNSSGASIPTAMTFNFRKNELQDKLICFAGFGVGLTWASILLKIKKLKFNQIIEY
jgi:3-oxoacyl-[acyl-carrier-protein] synthase-3